MFAYCSNNPVFQKDPSGSFGIAATVAATNFWNPIGWIAAAVSIVLVCALVVKYSNVGARTPSISCQKRDVKAKAKTKEKEKIAAVPKKQNKETVIYRYGGTNPGNFVPSMKDVATNSGLSFSTVPKKGAAMTTIEALNRTGIVYAVQDGPTHVTVKPLGGTIAEWREAGSNSIWTLAVKSACIKWDGEN